MAMEYIQYTKVSQKEFERKLWEILPGENRKLQKIILYRDTNGYVKEVQIGGELIEGERFREKFELASSDYTLEKINDVIEIKSKGIGHGFGFSQYEANQLVLEGKDYTYLLNHFFSNIVLEKI